MKLSVVIPVHNAAPWLSDCLDSILGQTLRDLEVIGVDDGSTDQSVEIFRKYAAQDGRVRVLTQENCGQGVARNRGMAAATGEFVHFMDADDALAAPDALAQAVNEMEKESLEVLCFDADTRVDADVDTASGRLYENLYVRRHAYRETVPGKMLFARFLANHEFCACPYLMMLKRTFLVEHGLTFPDMRIFHEDNIFTVHVLLTAERTSHRPWRLYLRKVHAGSTVTAKPTMRHLRGYLACYRDVCRLLQDGHWDRRTRAALRDRRVVYKLHVRRLAAANPELVSSAANEMSAEEDAVFRAVLEYPFCEKVANAFRCLRDRGLLFTVRRIVFGRQDG